jgi:hypothetical protein
MSNPSLKMTRSVGNNIRNCEWRFVPSVSQPDLRLRARLVSVFAAPPFSGDAAVVEAAAGSLGWLSDMNQEFFELAKRGSP